MARSISRREFLRLAALAAAATATGCGNGGGGGGTGTSAPAATPSVKLSGDLRILQWSHFVPKHDTWFDPFAQDWGRQVGVNVTVDHIDQAEIPARAAAEISARQGHDLIEFIFPPANLEPSVRDLSDLNREAERRFGKQIELCTRSTFNPTTNRFWGFCHGWAPDPGNFRRNLWERVGMENGPTTYEELLEGGTRIRTDQRIPLGLGMSNEIDSNMAARALIWSFGGSLQDRDQNVTLNSPETVAAVEMMTRLFRGAMTDEVFGWNAASNNQGLVAGQLSYILNSISAYRTAQKVNPEVAADIGFSAPMKGPGGTGLASAHAIPIYVIPSHAANPEAAEEFILHLLANYSDATNNSELYTLPAFPETVEEKDDWLDEDPYESRPRNKLALLKDAESWSTNVGHPGPTSAAVGEVFTTFVLPQMMAKAARGQLSAQQAVAEAEAQVKTIFQKWRANELVGGER
ncbi:MAG TPA: extracellular solute-binding protein [Actinomycetota bacterium]|nr:extracellular solute-binding protein [Actinomycetota bacterium]